MTLASRPLARMDDLQKRHRQEQKDLQAKVTQKKKSATKNTRKGVNDDCTVLEKQLKERQGAEISALSSEHVAEIEDDERPHVDTPGEPNTEEMSEDINKPMSALSMSRTPAINGQAKKPNRQKGRLARRAAEQQAAAEQAQKEADDLPNLRDQERNSMREAYTWRGLKEREIRSDGHCLYAAIADQLQSSDIGLAPRIELDFLVDANDKESSTPGYKTTRLVAAAYIFQNADDFTPFLEEPLDQYVRMIRETGEWGGHLEILALAKAYQVDINVLYGNGKVDKIECGSDTTTEQIWLAYYRHSFGLGEHYNSLRGAN